ncbi:MAG: GH3 auxin-responsive promoter family protein [Planctomycetota bacterium]
MIERLAYLYAKHPRVGKFRRGAAQAEKVQRRVLFGKLARNATSDFGRDHGFSQIRTVRDFRRQVPISSYDYYRSYVHRVKRGEIEAMFGRGTRVLMMSVTSGTTGEPKYIPITNHFFQEYRYGWNLWGLDVFRDHLDLVRRKTLQFSSDWHASRTECGLPCGSVSGLAAETRPAIARLIFVLPAILNKIENTRDKQYVALRLTMHRRDVGMMITANPLTLLNLARLADAEKESLVRDLFDGTLSAPVEVPRPVWRRLKGPLLARRVRAARRLEAIMEKTGHLYPRDFWPDISVLSVWTGGAMGNYLARVNELYGNRVFRDHGLSASEGRMTIPFGDNNRVGYLDYPTHYFEFIPFDEHEKANPTVLEGHELIPGEAYYILLTTSSGLYRYDIHDVVRCVDLDGTCPLLEFLNKGANFSNMAGEKLSENQVIEAVGRAREEAGLAFEQFTLVPQFGAPGHYSLLIESRLPVKRRDLLAARVDHHLCRVNCEYKDRIDSHRLGPLQVRAVPAGTWDVLREERLSRHGSSFEQYKHPFLSGDSSLTERLLAMAVDDSRPVASPGPR